jgi:hypothetical protein
MLLFLSALTASTAATVNVLMIDDTDHVTGLTGLTLTIAASKNGAAFATITPTVTELSHGWYSLALTSSHTDTLGELIIHVSSAGADPTDIGRMVVAASGSSLTVEEIVDGVWNEQLSGHLTAGSTGAYLYNAGVAAPPTAAENAYAVWNYITRTLTANTNLSIPTTGDIVTAIFDNTDIDNSFSTRETLRLIAAACAGKLAGAATTTVTIRNPGDTKTRITATVDEVGNRSALTYDLT